MHAQACVYDFVYLVLSIFTRLQIQHSIFSLPFAFLPSIYSFSLHLLPLAHPLVP